MNNNIQIKEKVYVCWSYHHILYAFERVLVDKTAADIVLVFRGSNLRHSIYRRIIDSGVFENVYCFREQGYNWEISKKNFVGYIYKRLWGMPRYFEKSFPINLKEFQDIYLFYDASMIGAYLHIKRIPYHLIEDAKRAFSSSVLKRVEKTIRKLIYNPNFLVRVLKRMGYVIPIFGESKYCMDIEVDSDIDLYRTAYNYNKFFVMPARTFENKLTKEDIDIIIKVFSDNYKLDCSKRYVLLLTEPLKANGVVKSFDEQKKVYQCFIKKIASWSTEIIMIKPHPRDEFDYKELLKNNRIVLLDKSFPSEILSLNSIKCFEHFYTIDSSAILSFPEEKSTLVGLSFIDNVLGR